MHDTAIVSIVVVLKERYTGVYHVTNVLSGGKTCVIMIFWINESLFYFSVF